MLWPSNMSLKLADGYDGQGIGDDDPCTACDDTGWSFQTERRCACGAVPTGTYETSPSDDRDPTDLWPHSPSVMRATGKEK